MNKEAEDIKMIREMMEKSSKFLSFNGLSIVFAGIFALIGATVAYLFLNEIIDCVEYDMKLKMIILLIDASAVLFLSVCSVTFFCWKKARTNNESLFNSTTRRATYSLLLPLFAGGIFSLFFISTGDVSIAYATTLTFYGLGLVNTSKYTFSEINILGITLVTLGISALLFANLSLYIWATGFGVCHIIAGFIMYFRYENKNKAK